MYFKTASDMRKLVKEKQEEFFPYELYGIIINDIEHDAKLGLTSHIYTFSTHQINENLKEFINLQKDWKILEKKLIELGFHCSSNIHLYNSDFINLNTTYQITIDWSER